MKHNNICIALSVFTIVLVLYFPQPAHSFTFIASGCIKLRSGDNYCGKVEFETIGRDERSIELTSSNKPGQVGGKIYSILLSQIVELWCGKCIFDAKGKIDEQIIEITYKTSREYTVTGYIHTSPSRYHLSVEQGGTKKKFDWQDIKHINYR